MSIILPYYKYLSASGGAFIDPTGDILYLEGNRHEDYARRYCLGEDVASIFRPVPYISTVLTSEIVKEIEENKRLVKHQNLFSESNLTREELIHYKEWIKTQPRDRVEIFADFLVYVLAFDKVETKLHNVITTTAAQPHIRFYNYYLMDWDIKEGNRLIYNPETAKYSSRERDFTLLNEADYEAEAEIEDIKAHVKKIERPLFFKE